MSHITTIRIEIKDLEQLKKACVECKLEFRENQTHYKWYGGTNQCSHAIGIPGNTSAYEVGVVKDSDAYKLAYDSFDNSLGRLVGGNCSKLTSAYAKGVAVKEASKFATANGWSMAQEIDKETGETVIKLRKY